MEPLLSVSRSAALFDILSHNNTYAEIRDFRHPGSLKSYGPPFVASPQTPSASPSLQGLVSKFLLSLPGLKDVPDEFWKVQVHGIIESLEDANLSESYDKGVLGSRKTIATAISALIEYLVRGVFGGFDKLKDTDHHYNLHDADDLTNAFRNCMHECIYGTFLDDLVQKITETDQISDHELLTQAVHEFILVNTASFMHYALVQLPKGQYLLKLLGNANRLIPYMAIRQTLKIGNVATMISAMMKVVLAKLSVTNITNWIGLTQAPDTGLNLMQQIISTVLNWDNKDFESRGSKIESDSEELSKEQLQCLKEYSHKSPRDQEQIRQQSYKNSISIIIAILDSSSLQTDLSESCHGLALEYLSICLAVRDRKEIIRVLCTSNPDNLTAIVRIAVSAYEPVIRQVHKAVDLSDTVSDLEAFVKDLLKMSKITPPGKDGIATTPKVGDYVQLLKKHQTSCHKFLHQCCKNGKELTGWYLEWAKHAALQFQRADAQPNSIGQDAGDLTSPLNDIFSKLSPFEKEKIVMILDQQIIYLDETHKSSKSRLKEVLESPVAKNPAIAKIMSSSNASTRSNSPARDERPLQSSPPEHEKNPGPGAYLARWQNLLDSTIITPLKPSGGPDSASSKRVVGNTLTEDSESELHVGKGTANLQPRQPDVKFVIELMGKDFRELLGKRGLYW